MLCISRKVDEKVFIGDNISVQIIEIRAGKVKIGIKAPISIPIHRDNVKSTENKHAGTKDTATKTEPK
jgi:carbon storage regulator